MRSYQFANVMKTQMPQESLKTIARDTTSESYVVLINLVVVLLKSATRNNRPN